MDKVTLKLQVFFEDPFWIGICERIYESKLSVSKITFGSEPKDYEILEFIQGNWYRIRFSPSTEITVKLKEKVNPKRLQRKIKKQVLNVGIGTKSQQALKLQHEECKLMRKVYSKQQKEEEQERLLALRLQKKKDKHRGR